MITRICAVLLLLLSSASLMAATFTPSNPDADDVIVARIDYLNPGCAVTPATEVIGATVRTTLTFTDCFFVIPFPLVEIVPFGPLPAGTYTYEVYFAFEGSPPELLSSQPLIVSAAASADIPALDSVGLLLIVVALVSAGLFVLRRY